MRLTTLTSLLAIALPPTAALQSTGCVCTLIGYENGLSVQIGIPAMPASYRVEVEAEGDVLSLDYQLVQGFPECMAECRATGRRIEIASGFIGADDRHIATLVTRRGEDRGPSEVTVRVYRDDTVVAEDTFRPRYQTDEPNGRGCGEHVFASAALDVPSPS